MNISQSSMALAFFKSRIHLGFPSLGKFFERADIQIAVVKPGFELGHVLNQKTSVLADGVAAHGRNAFRDKWLDESDELLLHLVFIQGGGFDFVYQSAFTVGAFVPSVHAIEQSIRLVDNPHRTFFSRRQMWTGHNQSNFQQTFFFGIEPRHLAVKPNQVVIRLGQQNTLWRLGTICNV